MLVTRVPDVLCAQICNEVAVVFFKVKKKTGAKLNKIIGHWLKKNTALDGKTSAPFPKKGFT